MKVLSSRPLLKTTSIGNDERGQATSTFIRNMSLPVHGWFRFSAGFSAQWVQCLIEEEVRTRGPVTLLDPFVGAGTSVLAGEEAGVTAIGLEAQPFIARIAKAKLLWHTDTHDFQDFASNLLSEVRRQTGTVPDYPPLIYKCYPPETLKGLHRLKRAWENTNDGSASSELTWLALTIILRTSSPAGTAPWQYVLPNNSKANAPEPLEAFASQIQRMASDMNVKQMLGTKPTGKIFSADARDCNAIMNKSIDLIITSPPYMNNYDYADATRLEMTFWREIDGWGDLHQKVRRHLIMSSSQHASAMNTSLEELLPELSTAPFIEDIRSICGEMANERLQHGGKKAYHLMTAGYFADMSRVWKALRRVCNDNAKVCFVIGDSAPYGIHVPVEEWMGQLALSAGFKSYRFEKVRDRNIKWKNRKHRVPLKEGRLWVEA